MYEPMWTMRAEVKTKAVQNSQWSGRAVETGSGQQKTLQTIAPTEDSPKKQADLLLREQCCDSGQHRGAQRAKHRTG